jgi:hypothetical protein
MAQVTLYLPDKIAGRIKREAKRAHKSVSAYVTDLATKQVTPAQWPDGFSRLFGSWEGDFPEIDDLPSDADPDRLT